MTPRYHHKGPGNLEKVSREKEIKEPAEPTNPNLPAGANSERMYRCTAGLESGDDCDRLFRDEDVLKRHVNQAHPEDSVEDVLEIVEPEVT